MAREIDRWLGSSEPAADLARAVGVPEAQMERALALAGRPREVEDAAARELAAAERLGARLVLATGPDYPAALRQLPLPPPVLAVRGEIPGGPAVAMVGSRKADSYGREVAELFARALAEAGVTVVSGFARGVDAAAHRGALASGIGGGGRTVAVLGCGLGIDYPAGHAALGREIAARGALVSEFPCDAGPRSWHFPVRNRVIAALAAGTLVVQATAKSGSLVTAKHALDLGREVWAVPGRIFDERSLGPNSLIRDGAALVQHPREILETVVPRSGPGPRSLPLLETPAGPEPPPPPGPPGDVLSALAAGSQRAPEELAEATGLAVDQVLGALLELELAGLVRRTAGGLYGR
ncbi:MAG: DNA-processing protein DprA [Acidobacteriota bacterium]